MLMPKRVKRRKQQRGRMTGIATRGNTITYGEYGPVSYTHLDVYKRQVQDKRIEAAANVYLECLECFVPEPNLIACFLAKTIVLQLILSLIHI